jgi:uncharacterized membrane protein SpoIIM required for sporulation
MNSRQFESENKERWEHFEKVLEAVEKGKPHEDTERLPTLFRQVCNDLSLAQHRLYRMALVEKLNALAISGYRVLERRISGGWDRIFRLIGRDFPQAVREEKRLFWLMSLLFWGPFLFFAIYTPFNPEWSMRLLGPENMIQLEQMYGEHTSPHDYMREEFGSNFMMFSFYIYNNVGIDLRTFAGGLPAGIGTLIIVLFNGAMLGASTGYIHHACNPQTFYSFVAGHSAPELLGVVVAGMAGMRLGLSILHPGAYDRKTALVLGGRRALLLLLGAMAMTSGAAVIEGFWSANPMEPWIKYTFGGVMWTITICYLTFSGRRASADAG